MAAVASAPSEHMPDDEGLAASRQQRMRRVRSAPVMSVTEQRNTMPSQRSVPAFELPLAQDDQPAFSPPHARDRGASTSPASVSTQNQATEVYAVLRPLRELGGPLVHSLPQCTKDLLKDVGICHYMTVFKAPDGQLLQFDFGPEQGRDIEMPTGPAVLKRLRRFASGGGDRGKENAARGAAMAASPPQTPLSPTKSSPQFTQLLDGNEAEGGGGGGNGIGMRGGARMQRTQSGSQLERSGSAAEKKKLKHGEIREELLSQDSPWAQKCLQDGLLIGTTTKSLDEIRAFNSQQSMAYELNQNDCRHYVNALCRFATGVEYASSRVVRDVLQRKRMRSGAHRWVVRSALHLMDVQTQEEGAARRTARRERKLRHTQSAPALDKLDKLRRTSKGELEPSRSLERAGLEALMEADEPMLRERQPSSTTTTTSPPLVSPYVTALVAAATVAATATTSGGRRPVDHEAQGGTVGAAPTVLAGAAVRAAATAAAAVTAAAAAPLVAAAKRRHGHSRESSSSSEALSDPLVSSSTDEQSAAAAAAAAHHKRAPLSEQPVRSWASKLAIKPPPVPMPVPSLASLGMGGAVGSNHGNHTAAAASAAAAATTTSPHQVRGEAAGQRGTSGTSRPPSTAFSMTAAAAPPTKLVKDAVCLSLAIGSGVRDTASATVRGLGAVAGAATRKGLHTVQASWFAATSVLGNHLVVPFAGGRRHSGGGGGGGGGRGGGQKSRRQAMDGSSAQPTAVMASSVQLRTTGDSRRRFAQSLTAGSRGGVRLWPTYVRIGRRSNQAESNPVAAEA